MATIKDVARYAGVSVSTVSRVINNYPYVTDELRERVLQAADSLDYRANVMARTMRSGRSRSLGLIVRDMLSANFSEICAAAEAEAESNNYELFVCNSNRNPSKERRYIESLLERKVDGLIVFTADDRINNLDLLQNDKTPVILVSSDLSSIKADRVNTCDEQATIMATNYLIELGHTRIAYLAWGQHIPSGKSRLSGYTKALETAGTALDLTLVRYCGVDPNRAEAETDFVLRLASRPTALIVSTTDLLPGALIAIRKQRLIIPRDLSILSFDDREITRYFDPQITVMKRNVCDLGGKAVKLVLKRLQEPLLEPYSINVPFSLVVRGSTESYKVKPAT